MTEQTGTFDRYAAREVLHSYADEYIATDDEALDALAGCVRSVPPQVIDRDTVAAEIRRFVDEVIAGVAPSSLTVADRILALVVPDSRFDSIRALHQPEPDGGMGYKDENPDDYGSMSPVCSTCGTPDEYAVCWPCATVRALDGNPS